MPIKIFADYDSARKLENDINTWASSLPARVTHLATSVASECRFGPIQYAYSSSNTITVAIWYSEA
jgi:hypothetical protein